MTNKNIILEVYDENLNFVGLINDFVSLVWTSRFYEAGEFDLYAEYKYYNLLQANFFIMRNDTSEVMQIKTVELSRDADGGMLAHITGKGALEYLSQRIIYHTITFSGDPVNYIKQIINDNVISPASSSRRLQLFNSITGTTLGRTIKAQVRWDNVLDKVVELLKQFRLGARVILANGGFRIQIYKSVDRTIYQTARDRLIFSEGIGNIAAWNFSQDYSAYKNMAYIAGEGEGKKRKIATIGSEFTHEDRYELYVDARDLSTDEGDTTISDDDYTEMLEQRGSESLAEASAAYEFNVEVVPDSTRYVLGEIATIDVDVITADGLISEITETFDENGFASFPSFDITEIRFVLATESSLDIITEDGYEIVT